jgi:CRP-like cAMP-binding protein
MKKDKHGCDVQSCMLCRLCVPEWRPAIAAHKQNYSLKKGEVLFKEGDPVQAMYFIYAGKMKVHKHWGEEKELIVRFAQKGDVVGHRGIGVEMIYPVTGTALEPTEICCIPLDFFNATLAVNHRFLHALMLFYAQELQVSEKNMRNLVHMPVKNRIVHALLTLKDQFGLLEDGSINLPLSRQDLASFTGTTYETAFRVMSELAAEQAIAITGKSIIILNLVQ